ncbi:armadillo-type protein [Mycena olivaceomarginata]|nr:armadillo-type protein [Mycena olivaceomarginata]
MPTHERVVKFIGCPAPINGYIRTPSMWRQIESLSTPDSHSITPPTAAPDQYVIHIIHPPGAQIVFLVVRCRAMVSGDPAAVNTMLGIIHFMWCHDLVKLTPVQIRGQFEKDYWVMIGETGGVVGVGLTDFKLPTKRETEEEGKFQRQRLATAEDDNDDPFGLPTRQEIEGQLAYQDGTPSMSVLESCLASSTSSVYGGQRVAESSPAFVNTRKMGDSVSDVRWAVVSAYSELVKHERFDDAVSKFLPALVKLFGDSDFAIRRAAVSAYSEFVKHERFDDAVSKFLPDLVRLFGDSISDVRRAAVSAYLKLVKHERFDDAVSKFMPDFLKLFGASNSNVRRAAVSAYLELVKHGEHSTVVI